MEEKQGKCSSVRWQICVFRFLESFVKNPSSGVSFFCKSSFIFSQISEKCESKCSKKKKKNSHESSPRPALEMRLWVPCFKFICFVPITAKNKYPRQWKCFGDLGMRCLDKFSLHLVVRFRRLVWFQMESVGKKYKFKVFASLK